MTGGGPADAQEARLNRGVLHIVLVYVIAAALWILFSDLLLILVPPGGKIWASVLKGWGFVGVTGSLLYLLLHRYIGQMLRAEREYHLALAQAEQQKRLFFQNTIAAVTEGKLQIRDLSNLEAMLPPPLVTLNVSSREGVPQVRKEVRQAACTLGIPEERVDDFTVAVGEAVTNAFKHASGGIITIHTDAEHLWVRVVDQGPGIADLVLPRVALERGYTTKPSLGMGYKLMLSLSDRVYLSTGPTGTTVVLELGRERPQPLVPGSAMAAEL